MSDAGRVVAGVAVGVVLGGTLAYLVFTPPGRRALASMDGALDDLAAALEQFRRALRRADGVVQEARGAVEDVRALLKREAETAHV